MLQSNVWVPEADIESFVGSAALGRARGYANSDTIRRIAYDASDRRLSAHVKGSGASWYSTTVTLTYSWEHANPKVTKKISFPLFGEKVLEESLERLASTVAGS